MQDVEQGEPQSQVLFRVTFLQCITLARQTLHHKSATYQQRHHEAARLPDPPARGPAPGSARPPPGSLRRIRTGEPAATGAGRRGRDRPGGDERHAGCRRGERNHPRRAPPEPPPGRRRGERDHAGSAAPVEPLPSRRPPAAAASGITPRRGRSGRTAGGGRARIHWSDMGSGTGRLCDAADEDAGGRHDPTRGRISRAGRGAGVARDDLPESPLDMLQGARRGGIGRGDRRGRPGRCRERFRRPVPSFASITHLAWWDGVSHVVTRPGSRARHLTREHVC